MNRPIGWIVLPSLLLGTSLYSYSEKITPGEAETLATEFVRSRTGDKSGEVSLKPVFAAGSKSDPLYYVFNFADGKGFVMVSAEDATTPVLGYSFEKGFPTADIPAVTQWMLSGLEREIKVAPSLQRSLSAEERRNAARRAGVSAKERKKQLTTPQWSQEGVFNQAIPGKPLVGCVGTAMATVMKYHNWPQQGRGELDGVSFSTSYDWDNMRMDNYRSVSTTQAERDAVALLMYHASKSIATDYGMSGSSAYESRIPGALSTYFGYDPGASYKKRAEVNSQDDWNQLLINEIDADRPMVYCGEDVTMGHAFVCDGYDVQGSNVYFHYNWGWGGSADGWYLPTVLNPQVSKQHNYSAMQTVVYNIKPAANPEIVWSPIHITSEGNQPGIGSDLTDLTNGKSFTVRAGYLTNSTYSDFNGKLAVALTDATGKIKTTLGNPQNCSFNAVNSIVDSPRRVFTFENCVLTAGITVADTDEVRIVSQADGSDEWLPLPGELYTCNSISAKPGVPSSFSVKLPAGVAGAKVEGAGSVVKGFDYTFTVTPEAAADENIITVKANGIILTSNNNTYRISNVCADQEISVIVQKASEVIAKRSVWVGSPGTLSSIISEADAANVKDLTVFGSIDARDFNYMRDAMNLERCDLSGVYISAYGSDQANAIPREAFRDERSLKEVILPNSVNRLNNGCFRCSGLTSIVIPSGVSKYEYNVFCSSSNLRDIWVRRDKAEFINWCVLVGINMNNLTLHVPSQTAVNNYSNAENWKDIKNIVVGAPDAVSTVTFAVQEDKEVLFETAAKPGQVEKGTKVTFKASHVADNDKKMEVYANATRLYPDADGNYTATIDANTILHFDLIEPQKVMGDSQLWSLNGKNGALGMFTDAINVLPNREFTVRLNALNVSQYSENLYWAIVLTDENSNIKEFISPINTWQAGVGDRHKLNVTCKVTESKVREGNLIRLVCSTNKRDWALVKGVNKSIVDAIPAVNHQDQLYAINLHGITDEDGNIQEIENATISGVESTALRGQDVTLSIVPTSSMYKVDMKVMVKEKDASGEYVKDENGDYKMVVKDVVTRAATVEYPFVALEDMDFEINVYNPAIGTTKVIETYPGGLHIQLTENNVAETVKISGSCRSQDLYDGLNRDWAVKTVKVLDLSELEIVAEGNRHLANEMKHMLFKSPTSTPAVVEKIILPNSILRIWNEGTESVFGNCKNLEEISLPAGVKSIPFTTGESKMLRYTLGTNVFLGCDKLKVIRIIGEPQTYEGKQCVCYFNPGGYKYGAENYSLGHPDATKVTVIVPDEYLTLFMTADKNDITGNPWVLYGYNILPESQNPVYGVEFDPSRVNMKDGSENVTQIATFLGDNVPLETISAEGMLFPANPDANATVYVDGEKVDLAEDGSIPVIFHNPKFKPELAKNHRVDVEYTVDLNFHALSDAFTISEPEVEHISALAEGFMLLSELEDENENTGNGTEEGAENGGEADTPGVTHSWDTTEVLKPVLRDVRENSRIRFKVDCSIDENKGILPKVMIGNLELAADASGYYEVNLTGANKLVEVFAVPTEGAVINAEDLLSIKPEEAAGITAISLQGEMNEEQLKEVVKDFKNLENLDLSSLEGTEIPEGAFSGMETLTTVVLPEIETISAEMFKDCTSLQSVDIPASVNTIGEGAFEGCSALEHITLVGISSIEDNAFKGCENLTTITLLSASSAGSTQAPAQAHRKRAATLKSDAFAGVNPNCMIVLDEGVALPEAKANYIRAAEGDVTEIAPDGTETVRKGRIYSATDDIAIVAGHPLAIPHAFTLENGAKIRMEAEINGWTPLVVPFDATTVTDPLNKNIQFKLLDDEKILEGNVIYTLADNTQNLKCVTSVKANTPVLMRLKEDSRITLEASDAKVPSTPSEVRADGKDYSLHAVYNTNSLPAGDVYVLNDNGSSFVPAEADEQENEEEEKKVTLSPFTVYATSPMAVAEIPTDLPKTLEDIMTGVENATVSELIITKENGVTVIYAPEAFDTNIYTADGKLVRSIRLEAGRNVITLPGSGIYVIADRKVII